MKNCDSSIQAFWYLYGMKGICNGNFNMTATRQLAIILAFGAL